MVKTAYYDKFECIGSKCPNSCCIGWRIDLDVETYAKYISHKDKNLGKGISKNENPTLDKFAVIHRTKKNGRCAFLDSDNLCQVQKNYSKELLSPVCSNFPRTEINFGSEKLKSLSFSCPEVSRLVFSDIDHLKIVNEDNEEYKNENIKLIPNEFRNDQYAVNSEKVFNFLYQTFNNKNISLKVCLSITNQIIQELKNNDLNINQTQEVFNYIKLFFLKHNFEICENNDQQIFFVKNLLKNFKKKKMQNKLSDFVNEIYQLSFIEMNSKDLIFKFSENRNLIIEKFESVYDNLFKKYFIHEIFSRISFLTNRELDSKEYFNLIFFVALITKLLLIFSSIHKKSMNTNDFINIISLITRYYGGREKLDNEEKLLFQQENQEDFVSLFYLFF